MARKRFWGMQSLLFGLLVLSTTSCLLGSYWSDLAERDFVLSQDKDPRLIGSWQEIRSAPSANNIVIKEYTLEGTMKQYYNGKLSSFKFYFFTKNNILYELELGTFIKKSNWTREYDYCFSADEDTLFTKYRNGTEIYKWERIVQTP